MTHIMTANNVTAGTKELGAIASDGDNPDELIGFLTFSTTGEVFVPRDWLLEQWENHGLSNKHLPKKTTKWQAYRRTLTELKNDSDLMQFQVYNPRYGEELMCKFSIEKSNEEGSNVFAVYVESFIPAEYCGEEGGNWDKERVGHFDFWRSEDSEQEHLIHEAEIGKENIYYDRLKTLFQESRRLMEVMPNLHNFNDLNSILESYRHDSDAVEIRRSVYFLNAHEESNLEALGEIWREMNEFKNEGEEIRIEKTPVVNMKEQREIVAKRVREKLQEMVDNVVNEIIEEFQDSADKTADMAANEMLSQLEESKDFVANYNQILGMKLSVQDVLQDQIEEMEEESEEVIENVINQQTFNDLE